MTKCNFYETHNTYAILNNQQQFRLNKINEIKDYFLAEIKERELMSKQLSKYIASFDYFDKLSEISHEDFIKIINKEKKYSE